MTNEIATVPSTTFFRRHRWQLVIVALVLVVVGIGSLWTLITPHIQLLRRRPRRLRAEVLAQRLAVPDLGRRAGDDAGAGRSAGDLHVHGPRSEGGAADHDAEGRKVALHYKEKKGIPSSCFGDTRYFISEMRPLNQ